MIFPVQPQARAVPIASAARLAVPRAEPAFPPRSRTGPRTGADSGGADDRDQRVKALDQHRLAGDLRVPERSAFLLVAVDTVLRGVDADERQRFAAGQQPRVLREHGGELPVRRIELPDVSPGIGAQMRPEGGRGADPAEHGLHRAVAEKIHVVDAVRPGGHARDQAHRLRGRVGAARAAGPDPGQRSGQPGALGEGDERGQAGVGQEVRVAGHGTSLRGATVCNNSTDEVSSQAGPM
jgi:hypothetical protein